MIKISTIVLFLSWLGIFLLPNHDLLNCFFSGTPLLVWKQLIASIIFLFAIGWALRRGAVSRADLVKKKILVAYMFVGTVFALYSLALGLSPNRVIYGLLAYSGLSGYMYFSSLIAKESSRIRVYRAFALLSAFCSVGLIVDYYTRIFHFLPRLDELSIVYLERHHLIKRAAFFFGASTTIFPFQAFGLLSMAFICARHASAIGYVSYNGLAAMTLFSMYLTGSRAGFYLMIVAYAIGYRVVSKSAKFLTRYFIVGGAVAFVVLSNFSFLDFEVFTAQADRFSNALSVQDEGNSHRYLRWQEGLELMGTISPEWFLGNGLGSTIGKFNDGAATATHFESSVLQAFYEGGFGLIIYRYLAAIVAMTVYVSRFRYRSRETTTLAFFIALVSLSTAVAPTLGAYHTQLVFFLSAGLLISLSYRRSDG